MFVMRFISRIRSLVAVAHQNTVEVISGHIGGGSWQQGPCLSFVVCDESLDVVVHQFVGEIHAIYPLHLGQNKPPHFSCD